MAIVKAGYYPLEKEPSENDPMGLENWGDVQWEFGDNKTIDATDEEGNLLIRIQPEDFKALYGVLLEMEMREEFKERKRK